MKCMRTVKRLIRPRGGAAEGGNPKKGKKNTRLSIVALAASLLPECQRAVVVGSGGYHGSTGIQSAAQLPESQGVVVVEGSRGYHGSAGAQPAALLPESQRAVAVEGSGGYHGSAGIQPAAQLPESQGIVVVEGSGDYNASAGIQPAAQLPESQGAVVVEGSGGYHGFAGVQPAALLPEHQRAVAVDGSGGYDGSAGIQAAALLPEFEGFRGYDDSADSPDVDGDVLQQLMMLRSKDPKKKLKALSTVFMLFAQKHAEEVMQVVPRWAHEYKRLMLDRDREVRGATNDTMDSLVTAVKKGLGPHLNNLMGPWWFSRFDPVAEVAHACQRSFEAAFPDLERRTDALMQCVKETFLYLEESLKLTTEEADELEDMHARLLSQWMLAMEALLDKLGANLQNAKDDHSISIKLKEHIAELEQRLRDVDKEVLVEADCYNAKVAELALLGQRFTTLSAEADWYKAKVAELAATSERRAADLASSQAEIHQLSIQAAAKDGEIERLKLKISELHRIKEVEAKLSPESAKTPIQPSDDTPDRTSSVPPRKARVLWTEKEVKALKAAVGEETGCISWIQVLENGKDIYHQSRRPEHLKQKWIYTKKKEERRGGGGASQAKGKRCAASKVKSKKGSGVKRKQGAAGTANKKRGAAEERKGRRVA